MIVWFHDFMHFNLLKSTFLWINHSTKPTEETSEYYQTLQRKLQNCHTAPCFFYSLFLKYLFFWMFVIYFLNFCVHSLILTHTHTSFYLTACSLVYLIYLTASAYAKNRTQLYVKDQSLRLTLTLLLLLHVVRSTLVCWVGTKGQCCQ